MNVYDFDKTLFPEDSTVAFFRFLFKRHPQMCRGIPRMIYGAFLYLCRRIDKTAMKECLYASFRYVKDIDRELALFWEQNYTRVYPWYQQLRRPDDLIISASPEASIAVACQKIGIQRYMASCVDMKSGKALGKNCHGEEKVRRFYERYPRGKIEKFYSDSYSDTPLARIAEEAYLIKNGVVTKWPEGKR